MNVSILELNPNQDLLRLSFRLSPMRENGVVKRALVGKKTLPHRFLFPLLYVAVRGLRQILVFSLFLNKHFVDWWCNIEFCFSLSLHHLFLVLLLIQIVAVVFFVEETHRKVSFIQKLFLRKEQVRVVSWVFGFLLGFIPKPPNTILEVFLKAKTRLVFRIKLLGGSSKWKLRRIHSLLFQHPLKLI